MSGVHTVQRLVPGLIEPTGGRKVLLEPDAPATRAEFAEVLGNLLNDVNGLQQESAQIQQAFLNGEPVELHQIMIKAEQAGIATDLLLEIRNRLVTAYNEIMRMPV